MEEKLIERGPKTSFFAGNRLTIADFLLFSNYIQMILFKNGGNETNHEATEVVNNTPTVGWYISKMTDEMADYLKQKSGMIEE